MHGTRFRLLALLSVAALALGRPGVDLRHGAEHHAVHEDEHAGTIAHEHAPASLPALDSPAVLPAHDSGEHAHQDVGSGVRERSSALYFVPALPAASNAAGMIEFSSPPRVARDTPPGSDHSTGPPPRLRAPPVS